MNPLELSAEEHALFQKLVTQSQEAKERSYSPYSKFRVGAALLDERGRVFLGCNVENCSYGGTICAERTAYCKAVSEGSTCFKAIAISCDVSEKYLFPCGICRQFMAEFGTDIKVVCSKVDGTYKAYTLKQLMPEAFIPAHLDLERVAAE